MTQTDIQTPPCTYQEAARWCAARGLRGVTGEPLPRMQLQDLHRLTGDRRAFAREVMGARQALLREIGARCFEGDLFCATMLADMLQRRGFAPLTPDLQGVPPAVLDDLVAIVRNSVED